MNAICRTLRRNAGVAAGILVLGLVVGCAGDGKPLDAGPRADAPAGTGGSSAGTGGSTGSGGATGSGGSGGLRLDGGFDLNLNDLRFDVTIPDVAGLDLGIPMCAAGVKTGDACTASDTACRGTASFCFCLNTRWQCLGN